MVADKFFNLPKQESLEERRLRLEASRDALKK